MRFFAVVQLVHGVPFDAVRRVRNDQVNRIVGQMLPGAFYTVDIVEHVQETGEIYARRARENKLSLGSNKNLSQSLVHDVW